jgi:CBS domain containing-hemolysin-like protein
VVTVLVVAVCSAIFISALCSVCEAVLYSLSAGNVEMMADRHPRQAVIMKRLKENIDQPITAILTLNTVANTIGASVAGAAAAAVFGPGALIWFSIAFTLTILLFSEILPKTIGVVYNKHLAPFIAQPLHLAILVLKPAILLCQAITRLVPHSGHYNLVSRDELKSFASLSRQSGEIEENQELVIANILQLGDKTVRQVMTPRTVTFSLDSGLTVQEAAQVEDRWQMHSRVPVYDGELDNVIGMVLSQDLFLSLAADRHTLKLSQIMRPVQFVPETAPLDQVFIQFFEEHQHLFVVVDEYGSVTGVITLEDIIEEIVGREIVDESDKAKSMREWARISRKRLRSS